MAFKKPGVHYNISAEFSSYDDNRKSSCEENGSVDIRHLLYSLILYFGTKSLVCLLC